jgi:hypothetical protein
MTKLTSAARTITFKAYWNELLSLRIVRQSYDSIPQFDPGSMGTPRSEKIARIQRSTRWDFTARAQYYRSVLPFEDADVWSVDAGAYVPLSSMPSDEVMKLHMADVLTGARAAQAAKDHELTEGDFLLWWHTWRNDHAVKNRFSVDAVALWPGSTHDWLMKAARAALKSWGTCLNDDDYVVPFTEHPVTVKKASEQKKKEQPKMAIESNLSTKLATVKTQVTKDAKEALYRTGAKKAVDASRALIVTGLKSKTKGNARAKQIAAFLETDHGRAALSVILGNLPLVMPQLATDPRFMKLAAEMRVAGLQHVTDLLADELAGPVTAIFTSAVAAIPDVKDDELQMARREEEHKLVIYIATPLRWLFFGLYDPLLWWAMKRVTNTIRVLVPDVDITRYREAGALVLVTDGTRADQVREAVATVHTWVVSSIQKIWL